MALDAKEGNSESFGRLYEIYIKKIYDFIYYKTLNKETAENGGWNRNYYIQSGNVQTIELGTPERAYVQVYKYENNTNEELLVTTLIFPIINLPENSVYYGNQSIVVPLVSDFLKEIDNQPVLML